MTVPHSATDTLCLFSPTANVLCFLFPKQPASIRTGVTSRCCPWDRLCAMTLSPAVSQARYKQSLDPTVDEVKKLCTSLRRNAKEERVLFHYNGHGVPRPTVNGEIWVFNKVGLGLSTALPGAKAFW